MVGFLGVYILYCIGVVVLVAAIARGLPYLAVCLWLAGGFLLEQTGLILLALLRGVIWCARQSANGVYLGAIFLFCLGYEWLRGPEEAEEEPIPEDFGEEEEDPAEEEPQQTFVLDLSYFHAVALLGLQNGFTQAELSRAYKEAMKKAHPDAGGSVEAAQAVNAARDLITDHMGWK